MSSINRYTFSQISLGQKESFSTTVTDAMMSDFFRLSGDSNPLHTDEAFAKRAGAGYAGKVVYGMLTASFLSTLAGVYLPGENSVVHEVEVKFPAPVYVGDALVFQGEVIGKNELFNVIELKVSAINSDGKKVLRGKMKVGVTE